MNARIGYPNEHLAGGHSEVLNNPMYSTCIGLILRGYHDYENGRMRFEGENSNRYMRFADEQPIPAIPETVTGAKTAPVISPEEDAGLANMKVRKRNENVKRLFDSLKGKFMKMFEDVEDEEIT